MRSAHIWDHRMGVFDIAGMGLLGIDRMETFLKLLDYTYFVENPVSFLLRMSLRAKRPLHYVLV